MSITPDHQGFANAQQRLRDELGRDVRFYGPAAMIYDPSIPASAFDEEGIPLDPLAGASAVASAGVQIGDLTYLGTARCNVMFQPLSAIRRDEVVADALGERSRLNKDLILGLEAVPVASGARYFQVGTAQPDGSWVPDEDQLWKVVNAKHDGFGAHLRYIVYGQDTR